MIKIMTKEEFEKKESVIEEYDYIQVVDDDKILGLFVSKEHAEDVKGFIEGIIKEEEK